MYLRNLLEHPHRCDSGSAAGAPRETISFFIQPTIIIVILYYFYWMLSSRKEGFIIRKSRRVEQSTHQQRRHMSQTEFYRKSTPVPARSPGHIVHVSGREGPQNIELYQMSNEEQTNPENQSAQQNFNFQESTGDLKQLGEAGDLHLNDKSFEEIEVTNSDQANLKVEENVRVGKILQKLSYQMQHRAHSADVLECVKLYIEHVESHELASVNNLPLSFIRKKILKQSLTNQRLSVLLAGVVEVLDSFQPLKNYLVNLVSFSLDNCLLRLAILTEGKDKSVVELLKEQKKQRFLNKGFETIKSNNEMLAEGILKVSTVDKSFCDVFKKLIKCNKTMQVRNQFLSYRQFIAYFLCEIERPQMAPFLSTAPAPFLPSQQFPRYTLIIDIFECLLTTSRKSVQTFRPFAQYFLDQMSQYFELVSFSDVMPNDANKVISLLDRKKHIKHRLFRHHLNKSKIPFGKDLSMLGRNPERVILIDTSKEPGSTNTIVISPWKGKKNDAELAELCPILAVIALKKLSPAKSIKKLQEKSEENMRIGLKHINCGVNLE